MQSLMKKRTIAQIIAQRKSNRQKTDIKPTLLKALSTSMQLQGGSEFRMEVFLKKTVYNHEDKFLLLRHLEKRYRVRFTQGFSSTPMQWLQIRERQVIDKHYDPSRRSYFLLKGRIAVCQRVQYDQLRETSASEAETKVTKKYEEVASVEADRGIGALFIGETFSKAMLVCENSLLLLVEHGEEELMMVERDCVMTTEERESFVKGFPLFRRLDNVNKHYTPFFQVKRYSKGELIYQIDAEPHCLYLIAEGEVQFQSRVMQQEQVRPEDEAISRLILRNSWESFLPITTEIVSKGNYFGEEEILAQSPRRQSARCRSLTCVLVEVPLEKLGKLLFYNDFRQALESSAASKSMERQSKIDNYLTHRGHPPAQPSPHKQSSIEFSQFNEAVFQSCSERSSLPQRLSLKDHRTKILHGSALRINPPSRAKQESFSMLEVNAQMYHNSAKRFRSFSVQQQKRRRRGQKGRVQGRQGRSLKQIWQVLKLQNVIQEQERVGIENSDGKAYFNAHMRLTRHIRDVKSYRPKTISSNCRVKTQFVEYLQRIV